MAQASRHVRQSFRTCDPLADERGFVEAILGRGSHFRGALLVPASDETLAAVSRVQGGAGRALSSSACPGWDDIPVCLDKALTARLAEGWDIPAPRTVVPRTVDEAVAASGSLGFPLLVKPAQSHLYYRAFGRKMARVRESRGAGAALRGGDVRRSRGHPPGGDPRQRRRRGQLQRLLPGRRGPGGVHGTPAAEGPTAVRLSPRADQRVDPGGRSGPDGTPWRPSATPASRTSR